MATHFKIMIAAAVLLALSLIIGLWPVNALGIPCGSVVTAVEIHPSALCEGKLATWRYPTILLQVVGFGMLLGALFVHFTTYRERRREEARKAWRESPVRRVWERPRQTFSLSPDEREDARKEGQQRGTWGQGQ